MERLTILGSTGSIGTQTLDIVRRNPERFRITSLVAHSRWQELAEQAREFAVESVVIGDKSHYKSLKEALQGTNIEVMAGSEAIEEVARSYRSDTVVNALVGYAGLHPTYLAIESGKRIALANKETLVVGGDIIMAAAKRKGVEILPIDSEHSAIMQCLEGEQRRSIRNLIVTCSGGALRNIPREELCNVTPEVALKHPQWSMGSKITIDSATLVNKGFEVIEARWLFDIEPERIKVVIHPQSIVHSMVEFTDGSVKAQLGNADMHTPISYALLYPERSPEAMENFSILDYPTLSFAEVDRVKYPALDIAYECLKRGGTAPCTMNGANEVAVAAFLNHKCGYLDIVGAIRYALDNASFEARPTLACYDEANDEARELAERYLKRVNNK
ncbi:MAG: 1-deoxy-D-xylulose-5-phosphate reductoisomerase [Alistipes sp.]|nr:1-deoxy-D-xylulose-5-phosphate reductoisomerase [Alistipes sp.]